MMDCKAALEESNGDTEAAAEWLRKKGISKAAKRAGKIAAEGLVASYIHGVGSIGVLVEVNCETDFVAKTDAFKMLVNDIAMHIAAARPLYVSRADVPDEVVGKEKDIYRDQLLAEGKPEAMLEKILEGKITKFYQEVCLLEQAYIKDEDRTIEALLTAKTAEIGEKITVRRFARYELGEGIEKETKDFVAEVAEQLK
jgi:elongation factor Ts